VLLEEGVEAGEVEEVEEDMVTSDSLLCRRPCDFLCWELTCDLLCGASACDSRSSLW
jgi:hypothetical protein